MKELREIIEETFVYGVDWTEFKDESENDHKVSTFAGKIKQEHVDLLESQIKAWIEENVIGEDEDMRKKTHMLVQDESPRIRNQLRQSQRQRLREEK